MSALDGMTEDQLQALFKDLEYLHRDVESRKKDYRDLEVLYQAKIEDCVASKKQFTRLQENFLKQAEAMKETQRLLVDHNKAFKAIAKLSVAFVE